MASEPMRPMSNGRFPPDTRNEAGSCSSPAPQAYRAIQVETRDRWHLVCSGEAAASAGGGRLVARMTHRTKALHGPLLESDERLADAASHDAAAKRRSKVRQVMLRVVYKLERDGPRPGDSDERKATLIENNL